MAAWRRSAGLLCAHRRRPSATRRAARCDHLFASRLHLCEEAKAQIAPLLKEFGANLTEINIDEDPQLRTLYDYDVPVIFLGARKAAKHRVDLAQFRRQLRDTGTPST